MQQSNIVAAHRIPAYNKDRLPFIVVQFHVRDTREVLLTKFWKARRRRRSEHLTAGKINMAFAPNRVSVNEYLSSDNKKFLAKLKQKCREAGYVFLWCRDGKFFFDKAAREKVQKVSTMADIDKLK